MKLNTPQQVVLYDLAKAATEAWVTSTNMELEFIFGNCTVEERLKASDHFGELMQRLKDFLEKESYSNTGGSNAV